MIIRQLSTMNDTNNLQIRINEILQADKTIPVVALHDINAAREVSKALIAGGIKNIEITLRTANALDCIRAAKEIDGITVGAGTVLNFQQAKDAIEAGVSYIVSPGYAESVHAVCIENNIPYLPGAVTPTEIQSLLEKHIHIMKFFPAEAFGGVKTLKALAPVFAQVKFCATGGITFDNAPSYFALPNIKAVGMSAIVTEDAVKSGNWAEITAQAKKAVSLIS